MRRVGAIGVGCHSSHHSGVRLPPPRAGAAILPDILVKPGGVVVSYFEWAQNIQRFRWEEERVNQGLSNIMKRATREVVEIARRDNLSLREAAFVLGVGRAARAIQLRGLV